MSETLMTEALVTGKDRTELLRALAQQLEPSLPELRAQWGSQEELEFVVADTISQAVTQIEQLLEADGRGDQVREDGFWSTWDELMASYGRVPDRVGEHLMPALRLWRSERTSQPNTPAESGLAQMICVAVAAGVKAARSQPEVTESAVAVLDDSGKIVKRSTVVTKRRAVD